MVNDVYRQESVEMTLGKFHRLWKQPRERLYNMLSLEVTGTG